MARSGWRCQQRLQSPLLNRRVSRAHSAQGRGGLRLGLGPRAGAAPAGVFSDQAQAATATAGLLGKSGVASATAVPAPGVGVAAHDAVAIDASSRTGDAAVRVGSQAQDPATTRARAATARFAVRGPATMTQVGAAPADPAAASNAVTDPHNGGIDRPRIALGLWCRGPLSRLGWTTDRCGVDLEQIIGRALQRRAQRRQRGQPHLRGLSGQQRRHRRSRHRQSGPLGQQSAQLGAGPHVSLRGRHAQLPLHVHDSSSSLNVASVTDVARRYASSMKVADGVT